MRIPSGATDRYIMFNAVDITDLKTAETGLTTFTVYYAIDDGAAAQLTPVTVSEISSSNMPGWYRLLVNNSAMTTLDAGKDTMELAIHITQASMAPARRVIEIYRPETTEGQTLTVASGVGQAAVQSIVANAVNASALATDAVTEIAAGIWGALTSGLTTASTIGKLLVDNINATISSRLASAGYTAPLDAAGTRSALGMASANLDTQLSTIDNVVDAILVDTGTTLDAALATVDTVVDAIKLKTDNLPASPAAVGSAMTLTSGERTAVANEVEAQIIDDTDSEKVLTAITDKIAAVNPDLSGLTTAAIASAVWSAGARTITALDEDATTLDLDATIRSAIGLASANLDTQLAKIDTLDTVVDALVADIGANGAGLTALPWNAGWDAEVQSEVTDALNAYDPPTKAEMDSAFATTNGYIDTEIASIITTLGTIAGYVDTEVAAIKTNTDKLGTAMELDGAVYRFTTNALEQAPAGGGGGSGPTAIEIADEVQTRTIAAISGFDPADITTIGTLVLDIPTNAELAAALSGTLKANVVQVNGVTVTGNGTAGNEWGPA